MKKRYKFLLLLALLPVAGMPQSSLDSVIAAAKGANPQLVAARFRMEAEIKESRTGLPLENPEMIFDYLWGDPASSGNRTDFGISQSFSFPSVYVQKADRSELIRTSASLRYMQTERDVISLARSVWIRIVGINRHLALSGRRVRLAEEIARKAAIQISHGEIDMIRYHHAQMESVNLKMERTGKETERNELQNLLTLLCGGKEIPVTDTAFPQVSGIQVSEIPGSLSQIPAVKLLENEISVRKMERNIAVSKWLPEFSAGYYSESVAGLKYQGITTGISIPLFQQSHSVGTADLHIKVASAELDRFRSEETQRIATLIYKRDRMIRQLEEVRSVLLPVNDVGLLQKALDAGEISISEFYFECSVFYTAWLNMLQAEEELTLTDAELLTAAGR
jgi:outer membrane protein TolC